MNCLKIIFLPKIAVTANLADVVARSITWKPGGGSAPNCGGLYKLKIFFAVH